MLVYRAVNRSRFIRFSRIAIFGQSTRYDSINTGMRVIIVVNLEHYQVRWESGVEISVWNFLFSRDTNCRERFLAGYISTIIRRESTREEMAEFFSR